ncbi:hypothetical protein J6497_02725 [Bradyrhizobium sp. CNPSo 4026]|nr:hypothetical protein [Bradyrhizobium cenepequi]
MSPSGSDRWPVVVFGAALGFAGCCIGAQLLPRWGWGGAVWAGGVVGLGGACAIAAPEAVISTPKTRSE